MHKVIVAIALTTMISGALASHSSAVTIMDNYFGGDPRMVAVDFDINGSNENYDVSKAEIQLSGMMLTVDIYSRYFDNIGAGYTALGDLFLSTNGWTPIGVAPYGSDRYGIAGKTDWEYALVLGSHSPDLNSTTNGLTYLYAVVDSGILTSDEVMPSGSSYHQSQEVQYQGTVPTSIKEGSWQVFNFGGVDTDDFLRFTIDVSSISGFNLDDLAIHWTMTCANDIIEGSARSPVPEPMTMALFGTGLLGLAGNALWKRKK
ncbi:MAG TPA: hypothetical protein DEG92_03040 [Rikenellaceae bacterium]|nr:hypothetical protein [Rikenellaceae bacterium]